ncbi:MAG: hypothetical protein DRI95_02150 [Bacteroidetes bacterium]|nr:MAG: hypothetical protein DRI95_02150 [Bacteroidota bacterium]RLD75470.1 MAG: hypothetical protein DRJ07_18010 [Bacteroidota bacterium]
MTQITLELQNEIAAKMNNLVQFFGSKELLFSSFIEFHTKKLKREIASMQEDLDKYEQNYKMNSSEFFNQFEKGKLEDSKDFILWSGIYEMQLSCKQKLQKLL